MNFEVGQRIRLLCDVYEEGEDVPPGKLASKGDIVEVVSGLRSAWDLSVHHPKRLGSFGVNETEVEPDDDSL